MHTCCRKIKILHWHINWRGHSVHGQYNPQFFTNYMNSLHASANYASRGSVYPWYPILVNVTHR